MQSRSFLAFPVPVESEQPIANRDQLSPAEEPDRLRVLLIGSRQGVTSTIHTLHVLGFAEVGQWSPLLPGPQPGTVVSILIRRLGTPPPE